MEIIYESYMKPPPLGIEPAWSWLERRIIDLTNAINRYVRDSNPNVEVPSDIGVTFEWVNELEIRLQELQKRRMKL